MNLDFRKSIYLLAVIFILWGCNERNCDKDFFCNKTKIDYKLLIRENQLQDPWDILLLDSTLVVANEKGEPLLETYTLEGSRLTSFLSKGNGPKEILMIGNLQKSIQKKKLLVYDLFKKKFMQYDLGSTSHEVKLDTTFNYLKQLEDSIVIFDKLFITKNYIIGESRSPEGRIALMNQDGSLIRYGGEYLRKTETKISDFENANLYASGITVKKDGSMLALATYTAGMIDVYSIKNNSIILNWNYHEFLPEHLYIIEMGETFRAAITDETRYGYADIESTDKLVYALYSGRKVKEKDYSFGSIIRIFDWNGSIGLELHSDINLRRITVSEDNQYIYAIAKDKDDFTCVVVFYIGDIIKDLI
ncbi:MAG: BF3164 family lipoprotein [Bacteroides graminisolvens]|nr:BF3164 family lipoprotein [Bacteroides graminisolvens]